MMKKLVSYSAILIVIPACVALGYVIAKNTHYYIVSLIVAAVASLPLILRFEKNDSGAASVAVIAAISAIAVASRAVFYAFPQIKPIAAVIIIGAAAFGPEVGFFTGAISMLLSNVIFGQGMWTPYQMYALGLVGFICGIVLKRERLKESRIITALIGAVTVFVVYGFIVDTSSALFMTDSLSFKNAWPVYLAGMPMNAIFAATTACVLLLISKQTIPRLERLKIKYDLFGGDSNE